MIGVDTNVLLRFLTADDVNQHARTLAFFRERTVTNPAFVAALTLAETIWVLRTAYAFSEQEIGEVVEMLCNSDDFVVEGREMLQAGDGKIVQPVQIADFLIAYLGQRSGCSHTVTFDKTAAKSVPGMELLS